MKRAGYVLNPQGAPLAALPVDVKNNASGTLVLSGATNSDGRWEFDLPDETQAYKVEISMGGASTQKVAQAPASTEHEHIFVRYGLKVATGATVELPAGTTIGGVSPTALPFVELAGDTMTGNLTFTAPAKIIAPSLGNRVGALGATSYAGGVLDTDAGIQLYRVDANNWSGLGGDGSGNMWWRTGLSGTPAPSLALGADGNVYVQRAQLFAQQGLFVYRLATPAHGLIYFGNTAGRYLLWDASRLASQDMPISIVTSGTASSGALTLAGSPGATDSSLTINHVGVRSYTLGVEGTRAALAPYAGFFIYDNTAGTRLSLRYDTGGVAIGGTAAAGATAQLEVKSTSTSYPGVKVVELAGTPSSTPIVQVIRTDGGTPFAVMASGPATTVSFAVTSVSGMNRVVTWVTPTGTLLGYMPLYTSWA